MLGTPCDMHLRRVPHKDKNITHFWIVKKIVACIINCIVSFDRRGNKLFLYSQFTCYCCKRLIIWHRLDTKDIIENLGKYLNLNSMADVIHELFITIGERWIGLCELFRFISFSPLWSLLIWFLPYFIDYKIVEALGKAWCPQHPFDIYIGAIVRE